MKLPGFNIRQMIITLGGSPTPDGADLLTEAEAEIEVWEATQDQPDQP